MRSSSSWNVWIDPVGNRAGSVSRLRGRREFTFEESAVRARLQAEYGAALSGCKACSHQAPADLQAIIDIGRGAVPLKDLKFRCTECSSRLTDHVTMTKQDGQPAWRSEAE